jgi:hypothetical protein
MVLAPGTRAAGGAHPHANPARTYGERTNRALLASENHGHPAIAATSKSGEFTAREVPVSTSHCATKSKFAIPLMHVRSYIFSEGLHGAPKDTREKRGRMICDSGCLARRRSCGGGYRKVTGRFGIFRPLNSYIYDIFGFVLSVSPPRFRSERLRRGSGRFFPNVRAH